MTKKKLGMTPEEGSEAFRQKVGELIDAGELDLTEADAAFERALARATNGDSNKAK